MLHGTEVRPVGALASCKIAQWLFHTPLLWKAIPETYRTGQCFTDFWSAYLAVIPDEHHAAGPRNAPIAHGRADENGQRQIRLPDRC